MSEKPKLYALLVGVEEYGPPVTPLSGCAADVDRMKKYLEKQNSDFDVRIKPLLNEAATKAGIVEGFRRHLAQAKSTDVALFYYSGHGTQEEADTTLWRFEADGKLETLVCYDGITLENGAEKYNLIADKELRYLLFQLAQNSPHIVTIFDCCHSGGNTRNHFVTEELETIKERRHVVRTRLSRACPPRQWEQFVFANDLDPDALKTKPLGEVLPEGHHISLTACSSDQSAFEVNGGGVFTSNLLEVLERSEGVISYYDLRSRLRHFIRNQYNQTPQIYAQGKESTPLFQGFLNRPLTPTPIYGNVVANPKRGLVMDMGAMHGISRQAQIVHVKSADGKQQFDADIDTVDSDHTILRLSDNALLQQMDPKAIYRGYVEESLSFPIKVFVHPKASEVAIHLADAGLNVNLAAGIHDADYAVYFRDGSYIIAPPGDPDRPLVLPTSIHAPNPVGTVAVYLRHISQYEFVKNLHNPNSYLFKGHPIEMEVWKEMENGEVEKVDIVDDELLMHYEKESDGSYGGFFRMKLTNRFSSKMYVSLLYLSRDFEVNPQVLGELTVALEPGESVWANEGADIGLTLEDEVLQFNWPESVTYFKLIANTQDFDASLLQQGPLPSPQKHRQEAKGIQLRSKKNPNARDWTTRLITLRAPNPVYREEG